jgi:transposase
MWRKRWSWEHSVARVAQKYSVDANQVFQWRRLYSDGPLGAPPQSGMRLLPVNFVETLKQRSPHRWHTVQ